MPLCQSEGRTSTIQNHVAALRKTDGAAPPRAGQRQSNARTGSSQALASVLSKSGGSGTAGEAQDSPQRSHGLSRSLTAKQLLMDASPAATVTRSVSSTTLPSPGKEGAESCLKRHSYTNGYTSWGLQREDSFGSDRPDRRRRGRSLSKEPSEASCPHRLSASNSPKDNIKVCVRIRPLSSEEVAQNEMECTRCSSECSDSLQLVAPPSVVRAGAERATYSFDWVLSSDAQQQTVYDLLGERVVHGVADGFHGCVFAYGQTGSGKSHTIFGRAGEQRGLLPRICEQLFAVLEKDQAEYIVKLSYLEVYNEKLRDLLRPAAEGASAPPLEVRQHPSVGVFVEGLTSNVVHSIKDVNQLLDFGHKIRVVRCTNMNAASSRSHAVVTLHVERTLSRSGSERRVRRRAQLHAVDLAGSERTKDSGDSEVQQKESKQINKSLWALSLTISRLSAHDNNSGLLSGAAHVPYRNSKLTYLLSDSLMGNCRTVMVACVSPAATHFSMTESTLRFASSAKKIHTRPVQNEEFDGDLVSVLRAEIEHLRQQLDQAGTERKEVIYEMIETTQLLQEEMAATWEEQQAQSKALEHERHEARSFLHLNMSTLASVWMRGRSLDRKNDVDPYLVNICDDPLLSGRLTYTLAPGEIVRVGSGQHCTIQIDGLGIKPEMCSLVSHDGQTVEVSCPIAREEMDADTMAAPLCPRPSLSESCKLEEDDSSSEDFDECEGKSTHKALHKLQNELTEVLDGHTIENVVRRMRCRGSFGMRRHSRVKSNAPQIYVNHELVTHTRLMQDGDRLRIGQTHVFLLCIPQAPIDTTSKSLMTSIISEIAVDRGEQMLAREYAAHLKERMGQQRAEQVFRQLQELEPLVEEANQLTEELRGDHYTEIVLKLHVLTDVMSTDEDPELAIALYELKPHGACCNHELVALWTKSKFRHKLEIMRDLYQEVSERKMSWSDSLDLDPWRDDSDSCLLGRWRRLRASRQAVLVDTTSEQPKNASCPEPDSEPAHSEQQDNIQEVSSPSNRHHAFKPGLLESNYRDQAVELEKLRAEVAAQGALLVELPYLREEVRHTRMELDRVQRELEQERAHSRAVSVTLAASRGVPEILWAASSTRCKEGDSVVPSGVDRDSSLQHPVLRHSTEQSPLQQRLQRTASANNIHQIRVCPSHPSPLKQATAAFSTQMIHALPPPRVQPRSTGGSFIRSSSATPRVFAGTSMACSHKSGPAVPHFRRRAPVMTPPYATSTQILSSRSPSSARSACGSEQALNVPLHSPGHSSVHSSPAAARSLVAFPGWNWPSSLEEDMGETSARRHHLRSEINRVRQELEVLYDWFQPSGSGKSEDNVQVS